ncbi:acyltransferase 3 [Sphingomonas sp. LH128]|uniref:acyltransferase family protein n=1 Tax=Sphingomonas sp. LH128 TaxID=473781 RepID=UPI00027C9BC5|nr:acyltransferase [Sphingomonas sp. LH128]EJU11709.1 acyltransferase 3 [Sphingomonas sp. LH128]
MTQLRQIEKSNFIKFRPDIEGMRAIAVLSVLLFHMGFSAIPGGFVGVDIFFVISGFLITQDIYNRSVTEKFNLMEFYLRRVRRIFPSLIAVLIASTVAAVFILLPSELENFSKSLIRK